MISKSFPLWPLLAIFSTFLPVRAADPIQLPNGLAITPYAAPHSVLLPLKPGTADHPDFALGQGVTAALSPDGRQLLVLTSGYNLEARGRKSGSNEYVLVYDVTRPQPVRLQALPIPNSFCGLVWNPSGQEFYVSGGPDDKVYVFARGSKDSGFAQSAAISLGHPYGLGLLSNASAPSNAAAPKPIAAGIAVNRAGTTAVVSNIYNDSVSVIDLKSRKKTAELDLRPDAPGEAGGEFPFWVAIRGDSKAYVSSPRDREIVVVQLEAVPKLAARIRVAGQPNRILLNRAQDRLYIALDNSDSVAVVDTGKDRLLTSFGVVAPRGMLPSTALP